MPTWGHTPWRPWRLRHARRLPGWAVRPVGPVGGSLSTIVTVTELGLPAVTDAGRLLPSETLNLSLFSGVLSSVVVTVAVPVLEPEVMVMLAGSVPRRGGRDDAERHREVQGR